MTFLFTMSWLGIACLTLIPFYGLLYVYFVVCNNRYGTAGGSFVNSESFVDSDVLYSSSVLLCVVLNEINQHAHRFDEKPAHFKLPDICLPVSEREEEKGHFLV